MRLFFAALRKIIPSCAAVACMLESRVYVPCICIIHNMEIRSGVPMYVCMYVCMYVQPDRKVCSCMGPVHVYKYSCIHNDVRKFIIIMIMIISCCCFARTHKHMHAPRTHTHRDLGTYCGAKGKPEFPTSESKGFRGVQGL